MIWDFINHSDDAHPIHLHQVEFQVCGRQRFFFIFFYSLFYSILLFFLEFFFLFSFFFSFLFFPFLIFSKKIVPLENRILLLQVIFIYFGEKTGREKEIIGKKRKKKEKEIINRNNSQEKRG